MDGALADTGSVLDTEKTARYNLGNGEENGGEWHDDGVAILA